MSRKVRLRHLSRDGMGLLDNGKEMDEANAFEYPHYILLTISLPEGVSCLRLEMDTRDASASSPDRVWLALAPCQRRHRACA